MNNFKKNKQSIENDLETLTKYLIDPKYLEIVRTSLDKTGLPKPFVQEVDLLNCNIAGTTFLNLKDIEPNLKKISCLF